MTCVTQYTPLSRLGELLKKPFGYDGHLALTEALAYIMYLAVMGRLIFDHKRKLSSPQAVWA